MSEKSLKRFLKHRDKKERGQLSTRKHLGLLEKKKDYKIRAADFRRKRDHIRALQQKAELRNPDEFYHEMEQKKVDANGNVVSTQQWKLTNEKIKVDKELDTAYLQQRIQKKRKEVEQARANLAALDHLDDVKERQHVVFVDNESDVDEWDAAEYFDTLPELVGRTHNRLTREQLEGDVIFNKASPGFIRQADTAKIHEYNRIRKEEKLLREMKKAHDDNVLKRHLMTGGRVRKIIKKDIFGDEMKSKTRYKWKTERKK